MTTPSTERKAGPLLGTGAQTTWPFTFKVFAATDIAVTIADSLGVETALTYGVDYTVTLNANQETSPGGTVTYPISGSPLPVGSRLVIFGNLPYDQPLDLPAGGNFSPLALENELDRLTMQIQQLRERMGRALQVSVTTGANVGLPAPSANELIGWDSTGQNLQNFAVSELATAVAYATMRYDTFTGDGVETQFTLTADPVTLANLDVAISGVTQVPGSDYSLINGVLVFASAPANGTEILARYGEGLVNVGGDSSDIRFLQAGTGAVDRTVQGKLRELVSVKDFGADSTGISNSSAAILSADATGARVLYPKGTYKYTSASNPTFAGGVEFDNAQVNSSVVTDVVVFDEDGTLIGLHHNHLQQIDKPNTNGVILPAPESKASVAGPVDLIAHWYNDFGLEGSGGWVGWYDWRWNHVGATAPYSYDPSRHPLLGWYRGDDPNVLDWQCYWLREYGISTIVPTGEIDMATWSSPSNGQHWIYQLFNNVKNFKGMRYIPWVSSGVTSAAVTAANWTGTIYDLCGTYKNTYTVSYKGTDYLCVFVWDMEQLRGVLDGFGGSTAAGESFFAARANEARVAGYGGLCILGREPGAYSAAFNKNLDGFTRAENAGFMILDAGYGGFSGNPSGTTFSDLVNNFSVPSTHREVAYVSTAMESKGGHPSGWTWTGSTPALFEKALNKAIQQVIENNQPRMVTIYNVAEWAEGGPGLQPNRQDGFGYLAACRRALSGVKPTVKPAFNYARCDCRGGNIKAVSDTVMIWSDFSATFTGATFYPTIAAGYDGQRIKVINSPLISGYSYTLNADSFDPGTNLFLTANQITLGPWDSVDFQYFAGKGWVQVSNVTNVA